MTKVVILATVVGDETHGISFSYVFGVRFQKVWFPCPVGLYTKEYDGSEIPFVVSHNVSIVDLYSYIVMVKPGRAEELASGKVRSKMRVHTVNFVVILHV